MNGESLNIKDDNLNMLKFVLPELFSEDQLDWAKLKAHFGDNIAIVNERYTLNWAGKSDAFKALQPPTTATLKPVPEESINHLDAFTNPVKAGSEKDNMFYELFPKAGYQLTDKIEKRLLFYSVKDKELILALEKMNPEVVKGIIDSLPKPKKVIALDILFANNDQLKTNTVLQMKDAGIDLKTI